MLFPICSVLWSRGCSVLVFPSFLLEWCAFVPCGFCVVLDALFVSSSAVGGYLVHYAVVSVTVSGFVLCEVVHGDYDEEGY